MQSSLDDMFFEKVVTLQDGEWISMHALLSFATLWNESQLSLKINIVIQWKLKKLLGILSV